MIVKWRETTLSDSKLFCVRVPFTLRYKWTVHNYFNESKSNIYETWQKTFHSPKGLYRSHVIRKHAHRHDIY